MVQEGLKATKASGGKRRRLKKSEWVFCSYCDLLVCLYLYRSQIPNLNGIKSQKFGQVFDFLTNFIDQTLAFWNSALYERIQTAKETNFFINKS